MFSVRMWILTVTFLVFLCAFVLMLGAIFMFFFIYGALIWIYLIY